MFLFLWVFFGVSNCLMKKCQKTICYVRVLTFLYQYRDDLVQKRDRGIFFFRGKPVSAKLITNPIFCLEKCSKNAGKVGEFREDQQKKSFYF